MSVAAGLSMAASGRAGGAPSHGVAAEVHSACLLPDTPYRLWERGELHEVLALPHDGTRVEVIDGEIYVSPAPVMPHNRIIDKIAEAFWAARAADPECVWECTQGMGLRVPERETGCVPDLIVAESEILNAAWEAGAPYLTPDQVEMTVEVTSKSNAAADRQPTSLRPNTKWQLYARLGIPCYLLVDRDPRAAQVTLYSAPDRAAGAYLQHRVWNFGETVKLPEPFGIEIPTELWRPWKD